MVRQNIATPGTIDYVDESSRLLTVLERANEIAGTTVLSELLERLLELIVEISGAESGTLYLLDRDKHELIFMVAHGDEPSRALVGKRISADRGIAGATIGERQPLLVDNVERDPRWYPGLGELSSLKRKTLISCPILLQGQPLGVIQLFNASSPELQLIQLLSARMASEIDKALLLEASERRGRRLQVLVDIIGRIGSTLDRDQLLSMIMDYACTLLDAEASSLFLRDEKTGDLILHISSGTHSHVLQQVRVPAGKGIIGHVVESGESILVDDVKRDRRHYRAVDKNSGFVTRSIVAVPLRTRKINLGSGRGAAEERIIGGLEALNKLEGTFGAEDSLLLETLASQAATVLEVATLYADANEMFLDVIRALTAAIDAKDPYTEGHSQRVSDFSVAIAQELGLDAEMIHHIRIGAILHDVGKIGIPDEILKKPGSLTEKEWDEMRRHPAVGEKIMGQVRMLQTELPALAEHHERLDGSGYPKGLSGDQISLTGRIVAVADVFDAITSDRPYRAGISVVEAMQVLRRGSGTEFDKRCVEALSSAYAKGRIRTQKERENLAPLT